MVGCFLFKLKLYTTTLLLSGTITVVFVEIATRRQQNKVYSDAKMQTNKVYEVSKNRSE